MASPPKLRSLPPISPLFEFRYRFRQLTIRDFRRLLDVSLPLTPLSVLIGANGSGKTSVLDVLALFAKSAEGEFNSALRDLSGLANILTAGHSRDLLMGITMDVPDPRFPSVTPSGRLDYSLTLKPQGINYAIEQETLSRQRQPLPPPLRLIDSHGNSIKYYEASKERLISPQWEHNSLETSLSQVPRMFVEAEQFRNRLASSTFYHVLNVEPRAPVRLPQPMQPATLPGKDGEQLISCLFYLRETERSRFEAVEDALRAAFPGFERLEFPPVAAGTLAAA